MLTFNQSSGICPEVNDWINMTVRIGATSFAQSFNILVGILSGPDVLLWSRDSRSFCTLSHEIVMSSIIVERHSMDPVLFVIQA